MADVAVELPQLQTVPLVLVVLYLLCYDTRCIARATYNVFSAPGLVQPACCMLQKFARHLYAFRYLPKPLVVRPVADVTLLA